jgi:uncharacterized membrane protein
VLLSVAMLILSGRQSWNMIRLIAVCILLLIVSLLLHMVVLVLRLQRKRRW